MKISGFLTRVLCALAFQFFFLDVSIAQQVLHHRLNMPRGGDEIIKQQVSYKNPGRSGENVLWDFSQLKKENNFYTLSYTNENDSLIIGTEHNTRYYYRLSNDSLLCYGYENQTTLMSYKQPELLLRFPVKYQDNVGTYFVGQGKYCDVLDISIIGTIKTHADSYGMIILPNNDTLRNVIRTKTKKLIAEETKPLVFGVKGESPIKTITNDSIDYRLANDSVVLGVVTYRWYAKGYRYPIFETVKSVVNTKGAERKYFDVAFFYPPQDHYYLDEDQENQSILNELEDSGNNQTNNIWSELNYNFHPNPVENNLEVEIYLPCEAFLRIQIADRSGRVVINEDWGNKPVGTFSRQLYMGHIPRGEYVLNIWLNNSYMVSGVLYKR